MANGNINFWTNPLLQNEAYWSYLPNALPLQSPQDFINFEAARMFHTQQYMNPAINQYYDALDEALRSLGIPFEYETVEAHMPNQPAFRKYRIPGLWDNMPTMISPTMNMTVGGMAENIARQFYGNSLPNLDDFIKNAIGSGPKNVNLDQYRPIEGSKAPSLIGSPQLNPYLGYFNEYLAWASGPGFRTSVTTGPGGYTEWRSQPWNPPQFPEGSFRGYGSSGRYNPLQQNANTAAQANTSIQQNANAAAQAPATSVRVGSANTRTQTTALPVTPANRRTASAAAPATPVPPTNKRRVSVATRVVR